MKNVYKVIKKAWVYTVLVYDSGTITFSGTTCLTKEYSY